MKAEVEAAIAELDTERKSFEAAIALEKAALEED